MIRMFRHRGLKRLFRDGDACGVMADQQARVADVLAHRDMAVRMGDVHLPGYRPHALKGVLREYWSITISGKWRIIFRFAHGDCFDVDLVDYH